MSPVQSEMVSIIIPAFNEADALAQVLDQLLLLHPGSEVIVVDDGSTDETCAIAQRYPQVILCRHSRNRGYGAALKTGVRAASRPWILTLDADGTYPVAAISGLFALAGDQADMAVGARLLPGAAISWIRRPAKWFLKRYAEYLMERDIDDLNSGLRLVRRELVQKVAPILPNGFSFSTTLTLSLLSMEKQVSYLPIAYHPRIGSSKIKPLRDTFNFIVLITRSGALFNPRRVYLPAAGLVFAMAIAILGIDVFVRENISDSSTLCFVAALQIALLGLLADAIIARDKLK